VSTIRIAVAVLRNAEGQLLLVRKRGTTAFMQPGGKIEPNEDAGTALARELREELGLIVAPERLYHLGMAEAPAANEPGMTVAAEIFGLQIDGSVAVEAEIAEAVWIDPARPLDLVLAPLTRDHILPLAMALA
jgi:8-oxo-dGTP pyrophosphatase MutT (NUDIX family)